MSCVIQKKPLESLDDLKLAGEWLKKLSETPDNYLRQRMADRWLASCRRSAHLGRGAYHLYKRFGEEFEVFIKRKDLFELRLACALKIRKDSWFHNTLAFLRKTWSG